MRPGIDSLLRRTFNGDGEADLVRELREDGLITLGVWRRMTKVTWWVTWHSAR